MHNGNPEESYISAVLRQIQWKKARPVIQKELEGHIEEHLREVKNSGLDDTAAMEVSVKAMGDPLETGRRLDRLHRPRVDVLMLISVAILIAFPLALIIYSITAQYSEPDYIQGLATTAIGFGIGIACVLADIRRIIRIASLPLVIGSLVGLLALYLVYMLYLRNSPNHMTSFPNSIYSWFYTVLDCCLFVFLAGFSGLAARTKRADTRANILAVATATVATVLIFMMHKYNLVCTVFACFFMLLFSGADKKWKAVFSAVLVGVTVFICLEFLDDAAEANEASHITSLFKTAMQHLKDLKLIGHTTPELIGIISTPASYISSAFSQPFGFMLLHYGILPALLPYAAISIMIWRMLRSLLHFHDRAGRTLAIGTAVYFVVWTVSMLLRDVLYRGALDLTMPFNPISGFDNALYPGLLGLLFGLYRRRDLYSNVGESPAEKIIPIQ